MAFKRSYHWLIRLALALIFVAQSYSLSHATRYGDQNHEHNGIACEITLASAQDVAILPSPPVTSGFVIYNDTPKQIDFISACHNNTQSRAPPPRAPPLTF